MTRRGGFALLGALWLLVLISAVGLELGLHTRDRGLLAANLGEHAGARSAALAGVEHARTLLQARLDGSDGGERSGADPRSRLDPWWSAGDILPGVQPLHQARYQVHVRDAGARLHLNRASEDELRALFQALRIDFGDADRLAQAIADWRDPDDFRRPRGAERAEYLADSLPVLPANRPFRDVSELRRVRGVTPHVFEAVQPYLTTVGSGRINLNSAPLPVLRSLPGMTEEASLAVLRRRRSGHRIGSVLEIAGDLPPARRGAFEKRVPELLSRTTVDTREIEVASEGWVEGGLVRVRVEALMVRAGSSAFLAWRRVQ